MCSTYTSSILSTNLKPRIAMNATLTVSAIAMFAVLLGTGIGIPMNAFAEIESQNTEFTKNYSPDTLLLKFKPNVNENSKNAILKQNNAVTASEIPQIGVKILKVPEHKLDTIQFALSHNPNVEFVEKDFFFEPSLIPNDSYYSNQWHLENINADLAWDITQGDSAPIAILDTGIDVNHPDLADKLQFGYNFYDNNSDLTDICGHGTKVAGSAAAISDNDLGVTGVAWDNPIIPIKITDPNCYGYYSAMTKGIIHAADNGARVANISFGIYGGNALNSASQYMQDKGGWVVAAGGNSGNYETYDSTGDNPYLISVAATSSSNVRTSWSSYGEYIDFAAPGSGIYTTKAGGSYGSTSGTSFSSPIVAGAIALLFSYDPTLTPEQVYDALKTSAVDLGSSGRDNYYGWGKINVYGALQSLNPPDNIPDTESPVISGMPSDITIDTDVSTGSIATWNEPDATDNVGVISFNSTHNSGDTFPVGTTTVTYTAIDAAGNSTESSFNITITYTAPDIPDTESPVISGMPSDITINTDVSSGSVVTWSTPTATDNIGVTSFTSTHNSGDTFPVGTTTVTYTAIDAAGNSSELSFEITVTYTEPEPPVDTTPPQVSITSHYDGQNIKGKTVISASASDSSGINSVQFYVDGKLVSSDSSTPFNYTWNPKNAPSGAYVISVTAFDMYGNSSSDSITLEIVKKGNPRN